MRVARSVLTAAVALGLTVVPLTATASAASTPKPPKLVSYRATLDVIGEITVTTGEDTTGTCSPGQAIDREYRVRFELGRPRKVTLHLLQRTVQTTPARSGSDGASHRGAVTNYRETNNCPPRAKVPLTAPTCTNHQGRLLAALVPAPEAIADDPDLTPLVGGVHLALGRLDGGNQDATCLRGLPSIDVARADEAEVSTLEAVGSGIVVPIGVNNDRFLRLREGKRVVRHLSLSGPCDDVRVETSALPRAAAAKSCTVSGKIWVALRRLK